MYAKSSIKKISVLSKADPLPVLPPNLRADLGEGECAIFLKTVFPGQVIVTPLPQLCRLPRCSLRGQLGEDRVGVGMRD
jgi:hypothetical protein